MSAVTTPPPPDPDEIKARQSADWWKQAMRRQLPVNALPSTSKGVEWISRWLAETRSAQSDVDHLKSSFELLSRATHSPAVSQQTVAAQQDEVRHEIDLLAAKLDRLADGLEADRHVDPRVARKNERRARIGTAAGVIGVILAAVALIFG